MAEIRCLLSEAAAVSGNEPALIQGEQVLPYSTLDGMVDAVAGRLRERGAQTGDRIGVLLSPDMRSVVLLLGLLRARVTGCLLNARMPPEGLADQLAALNAPVLVGDFKGRDRSDWRGLACWDRGALVDPGGLAPAAPRLESYALDHTAAILFTSGSRKAKAAALTFGNLYYAARASNHLLSVHAKDRWFAALPFYHVAGLGMIFRCLQAGAALVLPDGSRPWPEQWAHGGVTHLSLVPTQLQDLLGEPGGPEALASLKVVLLGGAAVPPRLHRAALRAGVTLCRSYGMTETTALATGVAPAAAPGDRASSGRPLPGVQVELDATGEILVRGPTVFAGYVEGSELRPAVDPEGWFHTGDLGRRDDGNNLHVTGRIDNRFVSGGENIQPEAVEEELLSLDGVDRAVVVPVPHPRFGLRPVAFLAGRPPPAEELKALLAQALPSYMIPDRFLPWPGDLDPHGLKLARSELEARAARWPD